MEIYQKRNVNKITLPIRDCDFKPDPSLWYSVYVQRSVCRPRPQSPEVQCVLAWSEEAL